MGMAAEEHYPRHNGSQYNQASAYDSKHNNYVMNERCTNELKMN